MSSSLSVSAAAGRDRAAADARALIAGPAETLLITWVPASLRTPLPLLAGVSGVGAGVR